MVPAGLFGMGHHQLVISSVASLRVPFQSLACQRGLCSSRIRGSGQMSLGPQALCSCLHSSSSLINPGMEACPVPSHWVALGKSLPLFEPQCLPLGMRKCKAHFQGDFRELARKGLPRHHVMAKLKPSADAGLYCSWDRSRHHNKWNKKDELNAGSPFSAAPRSSKL